MDLLSFGKREASNLVALVFATTMSIGLLTATPEAEAGIIKVRDVQGCSVTGLDSPNAVRGGVHCDEGDASFSLSKVLDGTFGLYVGDSQTPSWNLINDTGSALSSLTLFYSGQLAPNANIDMQISGDHFEECFAEDANGVVTGQAGKCDAKSAKPEDGLLLPLRMTWSGGLGIADGFEFNLGTASFAHSGQDAGCFSGTADCQQVSVASVPAPGSLYLWSLALAALTYVKRRKSVKKAG